ncbi:MAG: trypsin-like serine peptidase [Acidimicrobiia bacterium]
MTRKLTTFVAAFAMLVTMLGTGALAAPDQSDRARAEHQRIVEFWTAERISQAIPRDFVFDGTQFRERPVRPDRPGRGGTQGSSWNSGGEVKETTGKVLFEMGGFYYVCSGSVATESVSGRSVVVSAGHCVFDETNVEFATNWMFIPDYDAAPAPIDTAGNFCSQTEWGCWTATSLVVHEGYATAGGFNDQAVRHDWGFAVMGLGGHGNTHLDATVGAQPVSFASVSTGTTVSAFGYPAAGKYKGNDLIYCQGPVGTDPFTANTTYKVACTMTGGSSGGPWFAPFDNASGTGTQMSVNSYGYSGDQSMYGPMFNSDTQATWNAALSVNTNTIVD